MNFTITRKNLIKKLAKELAYLQVSADRYHYIGKDKDMTLYMLDRAFEVKSVAALMGVCNEVYDEAYKIYDFRNSDKEDFVADTELIEKIYDQFHREGFHKI